MATKSIRAKSKVVYRSTVTGLLISKKKALKLDKSLYTVETMATSGNKPAHTRTVYRNNATGQLITKAEAEALASAAYTIEEMPIAPADPLIRGLNIDLTGNWGDTPTVTADEGSNEKRGTVRVKPGNGAVDTSVWTLTFKHPKHKAPFALVICQTHSAEFSFETTKAGITVKCANSGAKEAVYNYLVTD